MLTTIRPDATAVLANPAAHSPAEIDTVLVSLWRAQTVAERGIEIIETWLHEATKSSQKVRERSGYAIRYAWTPRTVTTEQAWETALGELAKYEASVAACDDDYRKIYSVDLHRVYDPRYIAVRAEEWNQVVKELEAVTADIIRIQQEYINRGTWTRVYLVTSSAGHLHSSQSCHTCRFTTTYGLWSSLSGMTEAEMIAELGNRADALCSVCYPDAPVAGKRTNITKAQAEKLAEAV